MVSFETASGWLKHPASILAEHLGMLKTAGQSPRPCSSEGWNVRGRWVANPSGRLAPPQYRLVVSDVVCFTGVWAETCCVRRLLGCVDFTTSQHRIPTDTVIITGWINNALKDTKWQKLLLCFFWWITKDENANAELSLIISQQTLNAKPFVSFSRPEIEEYRGMKIEFN